MPTKSPAEQLAAKKAWRQPGKKGDGGSHGRPAVWVCQLRLTRERLRLSLRDVADAVKISVTALHQIEHGTDPQLTTAWKLAAFFGVEIETLWIEPVARNEVAK